MTKQEKRLAWLIPLITLGVVVLPLLISVVGIAIGIDIFDGVIIAAILFFVLCGLTVLAIPSFPLFIRMKQKEKGTLTPQKNKLWLILSGIMLFLSLGYVYFTYLGPLVVNWPYCPPDSICWGGMFVPYWFNALTFFGFGILGLAALPYLWFVVRDIPLLKNRRR